MKIPFTALNRQYANLREELLSASDEVYASGKMLDGQFTELFEGKLAVYTDRLYSVAVNSCSTALLICYLYYVEQCPKKNVALPALSFVASSNAPRLAGWNTTFIDVDDNGLIELSELDVHKNKIELLSYVNLYGNVIDYDKLQVISSFFSDLIIIEDAAQSLGASYKGIKSGKLGNASVLSFDPTKNLPNYGSGGMILTDDYGLYKFALNFRDNGKKSNHSQLGINTKMSESDCAQMVVKLKYFDEWQARRAKIAQFYSECLYVYADCPKANKDVVHAWHKYSIQTIDQFPLRAYLKEKGIETKIHYDTALPSYSAIFMNTDGLFPNADKLARLSVSLPIYPELTDAEVEYVVKSIQEYYD